jgi:hypothetical protein
VVRGSADGFLTGCAVLYDVINKPFCFVVGTTVCISLAYIYSSSPTQENHQGVL